MEALDELLRVGLVRMPKKVILFLLGNNTQPKLFRTT